MPVADGTTPFLDRLAQGDEATFLDPDFALALFANPNREALLEGGKHLTRRLIERLVLEVPVPKLSATLNGWAKELPPEVRARWLTLPPDWWRDFWLGELPGGVRQAIGSAVSDLGLEDAVRARLAAAEHLAAVAGAVAETDRRLIAVLRWLVG